MLNSLQEDREGKPRVKGRGNRKDTCNKVSGSNLMVYITALSISDLNTPIKWHRPLNIMKVK